MNEISGLRELITSIRQDWASYRLLKKVSKIADGFNLVVRRFPAELEKLLPVKSAYLLEGSTGRGIITSAPWIATFDPTITKSATQGFYLVYLFSVDLRRLYLSIAFGTTQFQSYFPNVKERHAKLIAAAAHLSDLIPSERVLVRGPIDLAASPRDRLHADYEKCSVVAFEYDLDTLPPETQLVEDYKYLLAQYRDLVANPLRPEIQRLLEAQIQAPPTTEEPLVLEFVPRAPKAKTEGAGKNGGKRISKESKKIGDKGEEIVFNFELSRVAKFGGNVEDVKWVARDGDTPGWDIRSIDKDGDPRYIEVKSSITSKVSTLVLTRTELKAATAQAGKYWIYLVMDVMKTRPTIETIQNPVERISKGELTAVADSWLVDLRSASSSDPLAD